MTHMYTYFYLIAYDISDDRQRSHVAKRLEQVGERVQGSVFECELTAAQITALRIELRDFCQNNSDSLRIYPLCRACLGKTTLMGSKPLALTPDYYLV